MTYKEFTPALGYAFLTPLYDLAIALLTREQVWRSALVNQVKLMPDDRIIDVGCGTGALAIRLKSTVPSCEIIGLDPDPGVLLRARKKATKRGVDVNWKQGFLTPEIANDIGTVSKIVSSLVFHQTPIREKARILSAMSEILQPGGTLHIADYGLQRTKLTRMLFRGTVQTLDGIDDTQPNADGCLPGLIESAGFQDVEERSVISTLTGSISLYYATNPTR